MYERAKDSAEKNLCAGYRLNESKEKEFLSAKFSKSGYGKIFSLNNIEIELPASGLVTIVGRSGASKSTLVDCLLGLVGVEARYHAGWSFIFKHVSIVVARNFHTFRSHPRFLIVR